MQRSFLVPSLLAACLSSSALTLTVRVEVRDGVPLLVVDGKPVRGRMFFGIPGSSPLRVGPEGKAVRFEFVAAESADNGTMHIRCGPQAGTVDLDDLRVVDVTDGREIIPTRDFEGGPSSFAKDWTYWPTGDKNTTGAAEIQPGVGKGGSAGMRITIQDPPKGSEPPDFHVYHQTRLKLLKGRRYEATMWLRSSVDRDLTIAFYRPGSSFVYLGGPPGPYETEIKLAADAGVDFVSFPIGFPWPEPGQEPDFSAVDSACEQVLRVNPKALLLPRVGVYAPAWWSAQHPGEAMQWEDGKKLDAVPASPRFREDAAERLRLLVEHLEAKYGDRIAGYHPSGQNTGEWFYHETWNRPLNGYAPADLAAWRAWLAARYRTNADFRKAWGDPHIALETAEVPTPKVRHASPHGVFRDPKTEKPLLDWADFQQEAMADAVLTFAKAVRQASGGRKLVVFFYGYVFEFGPVGNGPATSGHYALRRVLESPDVDVLCSPISYFDRGLGESAPSMTAAESVALAGKLWLNEDDTRTYLATGSTFPGAQAGADTFEDTIKMLTRNVGQEATRNFSTWWMDLGATGWFNDPRLWDLMRRLESVDRLMLDRPSAYRPEIAAVIDEESMKRLAPAGVAVSKPGIYESRRALGLTGAPYGQYLLDDVIAGKVDAKLYVVLNAWSLSEEQRAGIRKATQDRGVVWCYAPGWYDVDSPSPASMRELTGFHLEPSLAAEAHAAPTPAGRLLGLSLAIGPKVQVRPTFAAVDATPDEVLARYPDGSAAIALRQTQAQGFSLFVGSPGISSELIRLAARKAGVHLYTDSDCVVYAKGPLLVLNASQDGDVRVNLPKGRARLEDALDGKSPEGEAPYVLRMRKGDVRIFRFP